MRGHGRLDFDLPSVGVFREFIVGFLCVFLALALPSPGFGPSYARMHTWLGNALVRDLSLASGVRLRFEATEEQLRAAPWSTTLRVEPRPPQAPLAIPVNLRSLIFLPTATFVALALATPMGSRRRNLRVLLVGLLILLPLLLVLVGIPLLSFLGGTGPLSAFTLARWQHVGLQVLYRALVVPPGMAFAIPLLLWWALTKTMGSFDALAASANGTRSRCSQQRKQRCSQRQSVVRRAAG